MGKFEYYRYAATGLTVLLIVWGCLVVLKPFIPAILLAIIFCLATWPAFRWVDRKLNHRTTLSSLIMTLFLMFAFVAPLLFLGSSLGEGIAYLTKSIDVDVQQLGTPPTWLHDLPFLGNYLVERWTDYAHNTQKLFQMVGNHLQPVMRHLFILAAKIGEGLLDLSLGIIIAFFFFKYGAAAVERMQELFKRFAGEKGQELITISKQTMISVIYGVLGTALIQGVLAGIGFWIAGVPAATLLGFLTFALSLIPGGTPFVWAPATAWLAMKGHLEMAIFMGLWGFFAVSSIDNFIRPYFISLGTDLPILLVLLGVFGGILAFGFIGLFIGPTLLALAYAIISELSEPTAH